MHITKQDLLTMVILSTVFFGVATWNLGLAQAPVNSWQGTEKQGFYVDLGGVQSVQAVYFWVKLGNATVDVYSGSLGNWSHVGQFVLCRNTGWEYFQWASCSFSANTQYLRFEVQPALYDSRPMFSNWGNTNPSDKEPEPFAEVIEIGVLSQSNQQIPITGITGENISDASLSKLVDEQSLEQIPPTYMSETFFDEVYFARSATNYLNHQIPYEEHIRHWEN
jgi:dolichyl-phosphate-mannose-protein mannosyltransferase